MDNQVTIELTSHGLAAQLGLHVVGPDIPITSIVPISGLSEGALCFSKRELVSPFQVAVTVIIGGLDEIGNGAAILSANPRLDFARSLAWIDSQDGFFRHTVDPDVHPTARVGRGSVLSPGVKVGAGTVIHHNVVIGEGVTIGERCIIKSCTVIGENGFGFERDEAGVPIRLIHLGGVTIGNDVEIGSLNTICRGTLANTIVEDYVKTDDHVHIAHNCHVGRASLLTACVELSGGVNVGEEAWIGPNSSIMQNVHIGSRALVGIGANVLFDVDAGLTVVGNPAKVLAKKI